MSRPAAARRADQQAARPAARRLRPVPPPRRISGPVRPRPAAAGAAPGILLGAAGLARTLPDSRALDRLIRGRTWVAVIAVALIGIVAMQVHMLGLNAGIGRAVEKTSDLEQQNTALRLDVSRLSSGERIAAEAQRLGLVMPNAGEVRYTEPAATDAARAGRVMRSPDPDLAAQAKAAVQAGVGTGASALAPQSAQKAPGEAPAPVTDPAAATTTAQTPVVQGTTTQPQQPTQTQTQAQTPVTQAQAPAQQQQQPPPQTQQAPVQAQQQQAAPEAVTPAGGAVATLGG